MIGKILVAVDGSDNNNKAVDEAIELAKALGANLTAVHVTTQADVKPNAFGGDAGAQERAAIVEKESKEAFHYVNKAAAAAGIEANCLLIAGNPSNEIVELTSQYDLIVCGSLGRTGISKVLMGSVSSAIVKYAKCPVMITRRFCEHNSQGGRPWPSFSLSPAAFGMAKPIISELDCGHRCECSPAVRTDASQASDPGSNPGIRTHF